jgi:hypothetical protein
MERISNVNITFTEMEIINQLKTKSEKLVAFCVICISKTFADEKGVFYAKANTVAKLTGLNINTAKRILYHVLAEKNLVEIVEHGKYIDKRDSKKRYIPFCRPNKYKLLIPSNGDTIYNVNSDNIIHHFKQCYLVSGLKVSRRFKQWLVG